MSAEDILSASGVTLPIRSWARPSPPSASYRLRLLFCAASGLPPYLLRFVCCAIWPSTLDFVTAACNDLESSTLYPRVRAGVTYIAYLFPHSCFSSRSVCQDELSG